MKKNLLFFLTLVLVSCGKSENFMPDKTIVLGVESKQIHEQINSVSVMPFEVDDSWKHVSVPLMTKIDDTFILFTNETCYLLGYKENGKKVFSRNIKGRGRGEVLEVGNICSDGKTVYIYDVAKGELEKYDKRGNYCSKIDGPFMAEYLYPLKDRLVGMTSLSLKDNKYVTVFDEKKNVIDSYLSIPDYLKNQSMKFGRTPMSYCFKDSVRFMMPYDYNIYSVSENGIESKYRFVPENPIPPEVLESIEPNMPILEKSLLVGPYDDDFQGLFETDRYLFFYYSRNHVLYDKHTGSVFKTENPTQNYHKGLSDGMTSDELWKYFIGSFIPVYSEGNCLYGRLPMSLCSIMDDCRNKLDSRLASLMNEIDNYLSMYTLRTDDVIIARIDFEE